VGRLKARGFEFRWYVSDHPPPHVHIFDEKGRALEEAGFLRGPEE
jgi:hypothetical protein